MNKIPFLILFASCLTILAQDKTEDELEAARKAVMEAKKIADAVEVLLCKRIP